MRVPRQYAMSVGFSILFGIPLSCIRYPTAQPELTAMGTPPPSPAQVSACETTRSWHNIWTMTGTVFGGAAGASGTVNALTQDKNAQLGLSIGVATSGIVAAVAAAAAGFEADNYSTQNCSVVLSRAAAGADQK